MFNPAKELYNEIMTVSGSTTINLSASFTTDSRQLTQTFGYAIQFSWSGATTPVGSMYLEASDDDVVYTQIDETILPVAGASGSHMINVERPCYKYVRVVYSRTSGSGGSVLIRINGVN